MEKAEYWRGHHEAQSRSGLSVRGYCDGQGVKADSLHYWRRKFEGERAKKAVGPSSFIRVMESKPNQGGAVARISLGGGIVLECLAWPEAEWLRALGREA